MSDFEGRPIGTLWAPVFGARRGDRLPPRRRKGGGVCAGTTWERTAAKRPLPQVRVASHSPRAGGGRGWSRLRLLLAGTEPAPSGSSPPLVVSNVSGWANEAAKLRLYPDEDGGTAHFGETLSVAPGAWVPGSAPAHRSKAPDPEDVTQPRLCPVEVCRPARLRWVGRRAGAWPDGRTAHFPR